MPVSLPLGKRDRFHSQRDRRDGKGKTGTGDSIAYQGHSIQLYPGSAGLSAARNTRGKTMPSSEHERARKKQLWFPCGRYFLRTIKREDASDRWAQWLSDSSTAHVLNSSPRQLRKSDIVEYIKAFDQRSRLLLGIYERGTRLHVGIVRLDI